MTGDIGKIYADALFSLCTEEKCLDEVHVKINEYNNTFNQHPELLKLLTVPTITLSEKIEVISKIFGNSGVSYNFLCVLIEKNRIGNFNQISDEFNKKYNEYNNIAEITVTTSVPLTDEMRKKLIKKLEDKSGKHVNMSEKVNPDILGGIIVNYGNSQIDSSVKGKLENISRQLKNI